MQSYIRSVILMTLVLFVPFIISLQVRLGGNLLSWIEPTPMLSFLGLVAGFLLLSWQLDIQYRNTLEANRKQAQDKLRIDIYNEIAKRIEAASTPLGKLTATGHGYPVDVKFRTKMPATFKSSYSYDGFNASYVATQDTTLNLMRLLELYEIVMPEFCVFRDSMRKHLDALTTAVQKFAPFLLDYSGKDGQPLRWPPIDQALTELDAASAALAGAAMDLSCDLYDLMKDAQNYFIGKLFPGQKVSLRQPADPKYKVTTVTPEPSAEKPKG